MPIPVKLVCAHSCLLMGLASNYFTLELQDEPTLFQLETQPMLCISIQYKPIKFHCDLSEAIIWKAYWVL